MFQWSGVLERLWVCWCSQDFGIKLAASLLFEELMPRPCVSFDRCTVVAMGQNKTNEIQFWGRCTSHFSLF